MALHTNSSTRSGNEGETPFKLDQIIDSGNGNANYFPQFAKLEIAICMAMFVAFFDFDIVDKHGKSESAKLPPLNHNNISSTRQPGQAWLKCTSRT